MSEDTDTLLAMLVSMLKPPIPEPFVLLDALADSNGDIEAASRALQTTRLQNDQTPKKRKRPAVDLDNWLVTSPVKSPLGSGKGKKKVEDIEGERQSFPNKLARGPAVPLQQSPAASSSKHMVDLMTILRPPPPVAPAIPRLPPLTLSSAALVAQHTPCTLHASILPAQLASQLFYTMLDASQSWSRNKWWLFERVVESPHRTSFYVRRRDGVDADDSWQEAAQFWYNGRKTGPPNPFPPEMEEACQYIEDVVNEEMRKRKRFPLEWGGNGTGGQTWRANVAASNCYEGTKESVGPHSDQLTYLGPYPTIASLSLGTTRAFRLREVVPAVEANHRNARTYNIPLPHNSLIIMHASTQERFKHSIPPQPTLDMFRPAYPRAAGEPIEPSNCRINITFRFYRPDFRPDTIPRCKCDVTTALRPDMKNRVDSKSDKYWWACYAGAQNEGKGCNYWKVMDVKTEGRGPFVGSTESVQVDNRPSS